SVSYNGYGGVSKIAKTLDILDPVDYLKWQYELNLLRESPEYYEDQFGSFEDLDLYEGMPGNNWQEQIFGRTGNVFNHDISINGGTEKFSYLLSYANLSNKAIMIGSDYKRDNIALKLNHQPIKNIDIAFSLRYSNTKVNGGGANEQKEASSSDSRLRHSVVYSPVPVGTLSESGDDELENLSDLINPFTATYDNDRKQLRKNLNIGASVGWEIIDGLKLKSEAGFISYANYNSRFYGKSTYYTKTNSFGKPATRLEDEYRQSIRTTNTLSYDISKLLGNGSNHKLNVLLGQEYIVTQNNNITTRLHGFPADFTSEDAFNLSSQGTPVEYNDVYMPDDKLMSFFGRANYDFLGRYLISATLRADGSSKFAKANRWGYFPSVSVAWRISDETFMENVPLLNDLKLRASYGTVGNNNIPAGQMSAVYYSSNNFAYRILDLESYFTTATTVDGRTVNIMANPDLKWETTITRNLGLDFGLLKNKLSGTFELYYNTTKDLLLEVPTQGTGYTSQYQNIGETQNQGLEATLNWVAIDKKDFGLNIGVNIGMNRNTINTLGIEDFGYMTGWQSTEHLSDYWISEGGAVGQMYGYILDGRYEIDDFDYDAASETYTLKPGITDCTGLVGTLRPGKMKLKDINNEDGNNVVNEDDKTVIGDANPLSTGGFNISARFYGFDLSTVFSWSYGNDIYNANKIEYTSTANYRYRNMLDIMAEGSRWTNMDADGNLVNDPALLAQMNANTTMWSPYVQNRLLTDWAIEDGSFLRMNSLTLGYSIPESIISRFKIKSLRFYATCYNVFILTNYSGFDPEVSTRRKTALSPGVDFSAYPKSRQFIFGLNLNF
ncbi:MAG: SusC/RagA family TonB-linked outer membrane protein, partial [Chloroflexia bacterium]|nr:SusC/RagA family TonB-linked outer membrane protein [Chloroflexia bacterium]